MDEIFICTLYENISGIIHLNLGPDEETTKLNLLKAVKEFYCISCDIEFFDKIKNINIPDYILIKYIKQFMKSTEWVLEIKNKIDMTLVNMNYEVNDISIVSDSDSISDIGTTQVHRTISCHDLSDIIYLSENKMEVTKSLENKPDDFLKNSINKHALINLPDLEFKIIYFDFKHKKSLTNIERVKIAKIIIKKILELNINYEIHKRDFIYLSRTICDIFEGEIPEVYYTPAALAQKPSGKLYDAYSNYRKLLHTTGMIERRPITKVTIGHQFNEIDNVIEEIEFLKNNIGPKDLLVKYWEKTYVHRHSILNNKHISTFDYLSTYAISKSNDNTIFELFAIDTKLLYPEKASWRENLNQIYPKILKKAEKINDKQVARWLIELKKLDVDEDNAAAVALMSLPYFFPATNIKKKSKNGYKSSKLEMQEAFISYFKTLEDAKCKYLTGTQPSICFIGEIGYLKGYVRLIEKSYCIENPVLAVEHIFNTYMGLNLRYPEESLTVWNFVQKYFFNITTSFDTTKPSVKAVYQLLTT